MQLKKVPEVPGSGAESGLNVAKSGLVDDRHGMPGASPSELGGGPLFDDNGHVVLTQPLRDYGGEIQQVRSERRGGHTGLFRVTADALTENQGSSRDRISAQREKWGLSRDRLLFSAWPLVGFFAEDSLTFLILNKDRKSTRLNSSH